MCQFTWWECRIRCIVTKWISVHCTPASHTQVLGSLLFRFQSKAQKQISFVCYFFCYFFRVRLLNPDCTLLKSLGKGIPFEIAVGLNGRIWIKAKSVNQTLALARAISLSEHMNKEEMNKLCRQFLDRQAGFWTLVIQFKYTNCKMMMAGLFILFLFFILQFHFWSSDGGTVGGAAVYIHPVYCHLSWLEAL